MHLNYLPLRFTSDVFKGSILEFDLSESQLQARENPLTQRLAELRRTFADTHAFHRSGATIFCAPLVAEATTIGEPRDFSVFEDFQFANALARNALLRFFKERYTFTSIRPVSFALLKHNLAPQRPDVFGIYPEYSLDVRPLAPHEGLITSGVLVEFSIRYQFLKSVRELLDLKVPVEGLYAVQPIYDEPNFLSPTFARQYLGRIKRVVDDTVYLDDSDVESCSAQECFLEGSMENVASVGRALLGTAYEAFVDTVHEKTFDVKGAEQQVKRLGELGTWLEERSPLLCCSGLSLRIQANPHLCFRGNDAGYANRFRVPDCVLRPGGSITVPWPIDGQIDTHGPYDAESFPDKRVRIAVICPQEFVGEVGQFLRQFKEGVPSSRENSPFRQGFVRKYHLNSCDFTFHEVNRTSNFDEAYRTACLSACGTNPHLALVIIREQFQDLPDVSNPYYTTKARMMAQGIPVQIVEIETIRLKNKAYILNNLGLATYAKLGGIPWTLSPNQDLAHEIIFGIGSARIKTSRRGTGDRVVGITTVFSGDGQYLLANSTREVGLEDYLAELTSTLQETVDELRRRYNWRPKDRVRFVFHQTFKKYKDIEAAAVKQFADSLTDFEVQYAFVHVSTTHNWMLFESSAQGVGTPPKGKMVPDRGLCVPLGPYTALLTLTGPRQVKNALQGCPHPLLINVHEDSTFTGLEYICRQIFNLSFMSWRGFLPSTLPVSISYSDMIVDLLAHLRHVKNWNPDMLATRLKERRWFL